VSRARLAVVVGVLVVFAVAGGVVIALTSNHAGESHLTFNLTVTGARSMSPSNVSARQNDTVTINITSDTDGEVHLHEYDIAFEAKAGQTVSHTFKADKTCTCDMEWESTGTPLGRLVVTP
jgi:nitrous oxide reductase